MSKLSTNFQNFTKDFFYSGSKYSTERSYRRSRDRSSRWV